MLAVVLVIGLGLTAVAWEVNGSAKFYFAFMGGAVIALFMSVWDGPPSRIANWRSGSEAERKTAKQLRRLDGARWRIWHDLQSSRKTNVDHVVGGPSGLFMLDTKYRAGSLTVDRAGLHTQMPEDPEKVDLDTRMGDQIKAAAAELSQHLLERAQARTWVQPIVVLWADFPQGTHFEHGVWFVRGAELVKFLERQPPNRCDLDRIAPYLDHALTHGLTSQAGFSRA